MARKDEAMSHRPTQFQPTDEQWECPKCGSIDETMKKKGRHGWTIVDPWWQELLFWPITPRSTRWEAIEAIENLRCAPWEVLYRNGYRCVKVTIVEGWV